MNNPDQISELRSQGLHPFQAKFVLEFLQPDSSTVWELASPTGTGKTQLGVEIARRILEDRDDARVLIFVPKALVFQWTENLERVFPNTHFVDRRKFIEFAVAAEREQPPWPAHSAIVMSIDLAKREDISAALETVEWDLIVADESHLLTGKRANLFFGMLVKGRAKRGLMLTSLPTTEDYPNGVQVSRRTIFLQDVMDWQGQPILGQVPKFEFVNYTRSSEELVVLKAIENIAAKLSNESPSFELQANLLLRATSSSLYTAERFAWRLGKRIAQARNLAVHGLAPAKSEIGWLDDDESPGVADVESILTTPLSPAELNTLYDISSALEELLLKLEDTPGDSKLQALTEHLEKLKAETRQFHVCIWTQFLVTIEYLETALEKLELPISRVIGPMPADERAQNVEQFEAQGGVLLATDAALTERINLSFVDECIHYDLPYDPRRLEKRVGFLRLDRKKPFRNIGLLADDGELGEVKKKLTEIVKKLTVGELGKVEKKLTEMVKKLTVTSPPQ